MFVYDVFQRCWRGKRPCFWGWVSGTLMIWLNRLKPWATLTRRRVRAHKCQCYTSNQQSYEYETSRYKCFAILKSCLHGLLCARVSETDGMDIIWVLDQIVALFLCVFLCFKLKHLGFCDGFRIVVAQSADLNIAQR